MSIADDILDKAILPTHLDSAEIREQIAAGIRRRSFFSATVAEARVLEQMRTVCADFAADLINPGEARARLQDVLDNCGYESPESGGMTDLRAPRRQNLIIETQREMAESARRACSDTPIQMHAYPAWELVRREGRDIPRGDWPQRWHSAGESVNWEGASRDAMVALKGSPIWQALGDGAGGYTDTLGNPFPPFAYQSGMGWRDVHRDRALELGLNPKDAREKLPDLSPGEKELKEAVEALGPGFEKALRAAAGR